MTSLSTLLEAVPDARTRFTDTLLMSTAGTGVTRDMYHRYLSMQYHLTRGVQRYFLTAAAHEDLARMRKLCRFLVDFANEEELHYLVAAKDLQLGLG